MSSHGTTLFQVSFGSKTMNFTFEGITRFSKHKTGDNSNNGRTQYISGPNQRRSGREEVVQYKAKDAKEFNSIITFLRNANADGNKVINAEDAAFIENHHCKNIVEADGAGQPSIWQNNNDGTTFELEF